MSAKKNLGKNLGKLQFSQIAETFRYYTLGGGEWKTKKSVFGLSRTLN